MTTQAPTSAGQPEQVFDLRNSGDHCTSAQLTEFPGAPLIESSTQSTSPVPTQGVKGVMWRKVVGPAYTLTGWNALRMEASLKERRDAALARFWELRRLQRIIAVTNSKGGSGKTTVATWLSVVIQMVLKQQVLALDANENSGHTAKRLGIEREATTQLSRLVQSYGGLKTYADLIGVLDFHPDTGVGVVASDPVTSKQVALLVFKEIVARLKSACHTLVCDTGNGLLTAPNVGSIELADVLVFPGLAPPPDRKKFTKERERSNDSLDDITNTMLRYGKLGFKEKVKSGIVVILGAKPEEQPEYAARYGVQPHQVHIIPRNTYMVDNYSVDLDKIPLEVLVALLELAVAIYETPLSNDQVNVEAVLAAITSADQPVSDQT